MIGIAEKIYSFVTYIFNGVRNLWGHNDERTSFSINDLFTPCTVYAVNHHQFGFIAQDENIFPLGGMKMVSSNSTWIKTDEMNIMNRV